MSILVFNVDRSLSCIGSPSDIDKLFGIPPVPVTGGMANIRVALDQVFTKKLVPVQHPLFGNQGVSEYTFELSPLAKQHDLKAVVIDTVSHAFRQDLRKLEDARNSKQMEQQDWGKIEQMYNLAVSDAVRYPVPVIWNCHQKYDKDDTGKFHYQPQMKGSTQHFMEEYFDIVLFTKILTQGGTRRYQWMTKPDASHQAKDRRGLLPDLMPQDYSVLLKTYAEAGWPAPKILVIGPSGEGKTKSLITLAEYFNNVKP